MEVVAIIVKLVKPLTKKKETTTNHVTSSHVTLVEMFIAPHHIIKHLGNFFAARSEDEFFHVKGHRVLFVDCSLRCGDSARAVQAYQCLQHYDLPLQTHSILHDLFLDPQNQRESFTWRYSDTDYANLAQWWFSNTTTTSEQQG